MVKLKRSMYLWYIKLLSILTLSLPSIYVSTKSNTTHECGIISLDTHVLSGEIDPWIFSTLVIVCSQVVLIKLILIKV